MKDLTRSQHVTFVFVGALQTRGRLLKQIATLQEAGVTCDVIIGNTDSREPDPITYEFPITSIRVDQNSGKASSFLNQMRFCKSAARLIASSGADTVVCLALESLMAGVWAKKRRPALRLVFDNNELHIESFGLGFKSLIWSPIHNHAVRRCDVIFHAEVNRMAHFKKHYPGSKKPQQVIENFPSFREELPDRAPPEDDVRIIYLGGFGEGRFTFEIIDAFASLSPSVQLDIVGSGRPEFVAKVSKHLESLGVKHVRILPEVPYAQIPKLLESYHIGVALYRNDNLNNYYCAPNKVYDYLMNGMPVITNRYPGLVSVIEENRVGSCIDEVKVKELGKAVELICKERLWENITPEFRRRYCWERQVPGYLEVFGIHLE
jgi:glycosyltransferase involved in cell wall biosynthesis